MATRAISPDGLLDQVASKDSSTIDPKALAALLHMTLSEVAELARLHRVTLARSASSPEVQSRLGPIATILARAADMGGGLGKAVLWFRHQPVPAFGQKRASDLVQAGKADIVLAWLDALEDGAYA